MSKAVEIEQENPLRIWGEAILIAFLFLSFTNTFVVQTFFIPSESMEKTLLIGDHLLVNRFIFGPATTEMERALLPLRPVRRGDILIFRSKEDPRLEAVVKRVVAVAGDTVEVRSKKVYVNGEPVEESGYAILTEPSVRADDPRASAWTRQRDHYGPEVVPPDHVFCMGDNRDSSYDSRFWGPLPMSLVKGRAFLIYWSYDGSLLKNLDRISERARTERMFHLIR